MKLSRREFVKATVTSSAALAGGVIAVGCGNNVEPAPLAQPAQVKPPGIVEVLYGVYPDIQHVGGALTVPITPPATMIPGLDVQKLPPAILLVHRPHDNGPQYLATTSVCPHQACPLGYNPQSDLIECPCHASRFRTVPDFNVPNSCSGQVTHLPAKANLQVWPVAVEGSPPQKLVINLASVGGCNVLPPVVGGKVTITIAKYPALDNIGGFVVGTPMGFSGPIILVRIDPTAVSALDATCTHMNCPVSYVQHNNALECPCHGSIFDLMGAVAMGPAKQPLTKYPTTFDGKTVVVTLM